MGIESAAIEAARTWFVYFALHKSGAVKIGMSRWPGQRMRSLTFGGRPAKAELLGTIECDDRRAAADLERATHLELIDSWIDGESEWFHPTHEIAAAVERHCDISFEIRSDERCKNPQKARTYVLRLW